jgi:hypothetical protein
MSNFAEIATSILSGGLLAAVSGVGFFMRYKLRSFEFKNRSGGGIVVFKSFGHSVRHRITLYVAYMLCGAAPLAVIMIGLGILGVMSIGPLADHRHLRHPSTVAKP